MRLLAGATPADPICIQHRAKVPFRGRGTSSTWCRRLDELRECPRQDSIMDTSRDGAPRNCASGANFPTSNACLSLYDLNPLIRFGVGVLSLLRCQRRRCQGTGIPLRASIHSPCQHEFVLAHSRHWLPCREFGATPISPKSIGRYVFSSRRR